MARSIVMALPSGIEGVHEVFSEILEGSDRVVAVLGGALLDEILTRILLNFLRQDGKGLKDLCDPNGPLGTFSAKISMGYYLGCYGNAVRRDLTLVRKVRNQFAHQLTATFETPQIRSWVSSLYLAERYSADSGDAAARQARTPPPANYLEWATWVYVRDRTAALADPKERFIVELQALAWALTATNQRRLTVGALG